MRSASDRMPITKRFRLADIREFSQFAYLPDLFKQVMLIFFYQVIFQFERVVKMVLNRSFSAAGNKNDFFNSGGNSLFNQILDSRFIDDRQHFFRLSLCRRQESSPESGNR